MGYLIKEIREQQHMSQEELSKKSGVSRTTISNLENNSTKTAMTSTLLNIAKALGVTVDQIFLMKVCSRLHTKKGE